MKELILLRHAKSSWNDPSLPDHDRPLNARGERDAVRAGKLLKQKNIVPDIILTSTAVRAMNTALKAAKNCGFKNAVRCRKGLYHAGAQGYINFLKKIPDQYNTVLLVGHNPGLENLLEMLLCRYERFPTAALARLTLPIHSWKDLSVRRKAGLLLLWRPKEYRQT